MDEEKCDHCKAYWRVRKTNVMNSTVRICYTCARELIEYHRWLVEWVE